MFWHATRSLPSGRPRTSIVSRPPAPPEAPGRDPPCRGVDHEDDEQRRQDSEDRCEPDASAPDRARRQRGERGAGATGAATDHQRFEGRAVGAVRASARRYQKMSRGDRGQTTAARAAAPPETAVNAAARSPAGQQGLRPSVRVRTQGPERLPLVPWPARSRTWLRCRYSVSGTHQPQASHSSAPLTLICLHANAPCEPENRGTMRRTSILALPLLAALTAVFVCGIGVSGAGAATVTRYQQNAAQLTYTGTWPVGSATAASGGSYRYANTSGRKVTATFNGTRWPGYPRKARPTASPRSRWMAAPR